MRILTRHLKLLVALLVIGAGFVITPLALAAPPVQGTSPVVVVNTAYLNQRTGPGPEYVVQGIHAGGAFLPVVGRTAERDWWEVDTEFGIGWVSNEYVLTRGDFRDVPVVTEFGILDVPKAIIFGLPAPIYALPNPGSYIIGTAASEAQFPIRGRSYHPGTETWYWLIDTAQGQAWVSQDAAAVFGFSINIPAISTEDAFDLPRASIAADGVVNPPAPTPIPDAPVVIVATEAPAVDTATDDTSTADTADTTTETTVEAAPPAPAPEQYGMRIAGDCYALPLVNYLVQLSPLQATGLVCRDNAAARDLVLIGQADLGMAVNGDCGVANQTSIATLYGEDGAAHTLSFCTDAPNSTTRAFINWVQGTTGAAAIRSYRGLPGNNIPQYAVPYGE
jgi:uncharacterized protein YraI